MGWERRGRDGGRVGEGMGGDGHKDVDWLKSILGSATLTLFHVAMVLFDGCMPVVVLTEHWRCRQRSVRLAFHWCTVGMANLASNRGTMAC